MKTCKIILVFMLFFFHFSFSQQNLVPNYSFEEYDSICPPSTTFIYLAVPWFQPFTFNGNTTNSSSSDLFNTCSGGIGSGVPVNGVGYQYPNTGNGYAGIITLFEGWFADSYREYIEVELSEILQQSRRYCVQFYVSLAEDFSNAALSNMSIYFSADSVLDTCGFCVLQYVPQLNNPVTKILDDTANWMLISGIYTAYGGEKFIVIGNFVEDSLVTKTVSDTIGKNAAYYYIDDISVYEIDSFIHGFAGIDTTLCDTATTGIPLGDTALYGYQYRWSPPYSLSDTTSAQPIAKPDSTTTYYLTVTDTFRYRCRQGEAVGRDTVTVTVKNCMGIREYFGKNNWVTKIYPNPNSGEMKMEYAIKKNHEAVFEIYSIYGDKIISQILKPEENKLFINKNTITPGIYFYNVYVDEQPVLRDRIVVIR